MRTIVPWSMVLQRAALCPVILLGAYRDWDGRWLGGMVLFALVDDVLDGMVARRWGSDTAALRLADSCADTVFYLGAAGALWIRQPQVLRANDWLLALLFAMEGGRYVLDFCRYGRAASYHSYLAKAWGVVLATALIGVLSFGGLQTLVRVAILLGIVVNIEGLAMSLMLRRWHHDVKTVAVAWRLRQEDQQGRREA